MCSTCFDTARPSAAGPELDDAARALHRQGARPVPSRGCPAAPPRAPRCGGDQPAAAGTPERRGGDAGAAPGGNAARAYRAAAWHARRGGGPGAGLGSARGACWQSATSRSSRRWWPPWSAGGCGSSSRRAAWSSSRSSLRDRRAPPCAGWCGRPTFATRIDVRGPRPEPGNQMPAISSGGRRRDSAEGGAPSKGADPPGWSVKDTSCTRQPTQAEAQAGESTTWSSQTVLQPEGPER